MNLYDTITQSDLNDVIDLLLNNYHREIDLNIDDSSNDYCSLEFDLSDGVDAGDEVIFNDGDNLSISISDKRLAEMGYTLRFFYYQLDKADYTGGKPYGDLQSFDVKLDTDTTVVPFEDNQVYLQKDFVLVLLKDVGYRLLLNASSSIVLPGDDVVLTADYTLGSVPVEDASVEFYNGETLIDTVDTDEDGLAVLTVSDLSLGSYNFSCVCNGVYSDMVSVSVGSDIVMELEVTGSSFSTYSSNTFYYTGRVFVDFDDGTVIEYNGGQLSHTYATSGEYTVKIYGNITGLKQGCFAFYRGLTSINIPSSVTSIDYQCFDGCTGLTSINIPSSVTSIGANCFKNCTGLTSITLSDSLTSIGNYCFHGCTGLTSINIPSSVTSIGNTCFRECTGLTSIQLNWNTTTEIITYNSTWIYQASANVKFSIPNSTTSLYTSKNYPSNLLVERT